MNSSSSAGVAKLFQSELVFQFVTENAKSQVVTLHELPLLSPVLLCDRCTGRAIKAMTGELEDLPGLEAFRAKAFGVDAVTADRAGANDRCEDGKYFSCPRRSRLRLPCATHICATVQGKCFGTISADVSGMVAKALMLRESGGLWTSVIV